MGGWSTGGGSGSSSTGTKSTQLTRATDQSASGLMVWTAEDSNKTLTPTIWDGASVFTITTAGWYTASFNAYASSTARPYLTLGSLTGYGTAAAVDTLTISGYLAVNDTVSCGWWTGSGTALGGSNQLSLRKD